MAVAFQPRFFSMPKSIEWKHIFTYVQLGKWRWLALWFKIGVGVLDKPRVNKNYILCITMYSLIWLWLRNHIQIKWFKLISNVFMLNPVNYKYCTLGHNKDLSSLCDQTQIWTTSLVHHPNCSAPNTRQSIKWSNSQRGLGAQGLCGVTYMYDYPKLL